MIIIKYSKKFLSLTLCIPFLTNPIFSYAMFDGEGTSSQSQEKNSKDVKITVTDSETDSKEKTASDSTLDNATATQENSPALKRKDTASRNFVISHTSSLQVPCESTVLSKNRERERNYIRLKASMDKMCYTEEILKNHYGQDLSMHKLLLIATTCCYLDSSIKLDRDAKRNKSILLTWFCENFEKIGSIINVGVTNRAYKKHQEKICKKVEHIC